MCGASPGTGGRSPFIREARKAALTDSSGDIQSYAQPCFRRTAEHREPSSGGIEDRKGATSMSGRLFMTMLYVLATSLPAATDCSIQPAFDQPDDARIIHVYKTGAEA